MFATTTSFCEPRVDVDSIYALLYRECHRLFPDEMFADLFSDVGRYCVPPMIVAVVMVLQRIEGCSDREAVERFAYDMRWKYAAGGLDFDFPGFVHTVLVDMRARLRESVDPDRIFNVTVDAAKRAGLVGRRRVLDSTPLYDAVATMDTVTLVRSAIRGLLAVCDTELEARLRGVLERDDDYGSAGKPVCDWDDREARETLIDALANDALALLVALEGVNLEPEVGQAATLLAAVVGQDLDEDEDGVFVIARRVAKDRIISTVDPDARHGHKTSARGFDGYKGHVSVDPDSELIVATTVSAGNAGDAAAVDELLADDLHDLQPAEPQAEQAATDQADAEQTDAEQTDPVRADGQDDPGQDDPEQAAGGPGRWRERTVVGVRRLGLWQRRGARQTRTSRRRDLHQDPAADRARRTVCQGQIHDQPRRSDRYLPGRAHRRADRQRASTGRKVRRLVCQLPAGGPVHHLKARPHDPRRPARATTRTRPRAPTRPQLDRGVQRQAPDRRAQNRSPHTPQTRRPPRPRTRQTQSLSRLQPPRRSRQPRPTRRARTDRPKRPLASHHRLKPPPAGARARQRVPTEHSASHNARPTTAVTPSSPPNRVQAPLPTPVRHQSPSGAY